jgi:hypothetical protein
MSEKRRCQYPKCGRVIVYHKKSFSWTHATPGADHAPIPEKEAPHGQ